MRYQYVSESAQAREPQIDDLSEGDAHSHKHNKNESLIWWISQIIFVELTA